MLKFVRFAKCPVTSRIPSIAIVLTVWYVIFAPVSNPNCVSFITNFAPPRPSPHRHYVSIPRYSLHGNPRRSESAVFHP